MSSSSKSRRTLSPNRLFAERASLRLAVQNVEALRGTEVEALSGDVRGFFEKIFGFTPFKYQLELADMFEKNQFTRSCCRTAW